MNTINLMTRTFLMFSFLFCTVLSFSQSIDELEIIPEDPINTEDVVSVIATAWHPNSGCPVVGTEFFYSQDTITVFVEHQQGLATAICNSIDTTSLGSFAPGTYKVEYVMVSSLFGDLAITDTAYTEFTVEGVNSTNNFDAYSTITIYPNPSHGNLFVETDWRGEFAVYDLLGKELKKFRMDRSPFYFSTESFAPGVYIIRPFDGSAFEGGKFVVR